MRAGMRATTRAPRQMNGAFEHLGIYLSPTLVQWYSTQRHHAPYYYMIVFKVYTQLLHDCIFTACTQLLLDDCVTSQSFLWMHVTH
jgi:hypothetical protein